MVSLPEHTLEAAGKPDIRDADAIYENPGLKGNFAIGRC